MFVRSVLLCASLFLSASGPCYGAAVYFNDFEGAIGPEWFNARLSSTPEGCNHCTSFLGEFGNDILWFTLDGLPPHVDATLTFDLYAIRSWDGSLTAYGGPDIFFVEDVTGSLDFATTISNNYPFGSLFYQAYPQSWPTTRRFPSQSGAAERQSLGYRFDTNPIGVLPMDSIYRMTFQFRHSAPSFTAVFGAHNLSSLSDESWGVDNVMFAVRPVPEPTTISLCLLAIVVFAIRSRLRQRNSRCLY